MDAGPLRDLPDAPRIAAQRRRRELHDRSTTGADERRELLDGGVDIGQAVVVRVDARVPARLRGDGRIPGTGVVRDVAVDRQQRRRVHPEVLVRERDPEITWLDRTADGLDDQAAIDPGRRSSELDALGEGGVRDTGQAQHQVHVVRPGRDRLRQADLGGLQATDVEPALRAQVRGGDGDPGLAGGRVDEREPVARRRPRRPAAGPARRRSATPAPGWSRGSPGPRPRRPVSPPGPRARAAPASSAPRTSAGPRTDPCVSPRNAASARSASRPAAASIWAAPVAASTVKRGFGPYTPTIVAAGSSGRRSVVTRSGASAAIQDVSIVAPWSTATGQSVPSPVPRTALSSR